MLTLEMVVDSVFPCGLAVTVYFPPLHCPFSEVALLKVISLPIRGFSVSVFPSTLALIIKESGTSTLLRYRLLVATE